MVMFRRNFLRGLLAAVVSGGMYGQAHAASKLDADMMKAALRTAAPEEDGFIEYVVKRVDDGTLPQSLVESTLQWARRKSRLKFQYFKWSLLVRAQRAGIRL